VDVASVRKNERELKEKRMIDIKSTSVSANSIDDWPFSSRIFLIQGFPGLMKMRKLLLPLSVALG